MYMQRAASGAAGNGLYTTAKYVRGAAGIRLGTTIKYLRRTTRAAANNGPGHHDQVSRELNAGASKNWANANINNSLARFLMNHLVSVSPFLVNSEPHIGERSSVRFCVGPRSMTHEI
jgi:hypothetical protein